MATALELWDEGKNLIGRTVESTITDTPKEYGVISEYNGPPYTPGATIKWHNGRISWWPLSDLRIVDTCKCCGATLHEIDPEDICMDCVDIGCNVKDES